MFHAYTDTFSFVLQSPFNVTSFTMIGDENANAYFRIDPSNGQIYTTSALDAVSTPVFSVSERAVTIL